jgi:hypothetical protein
VKELVEDLGPHCPGKWDEWTAALHAEDVQTESDLLKISDEDFNFMRVSVMLKSALRAHRTAEFARMRESNTPLATSKKIGPRICHVSVRILALSDIDMTRNSFKVELILFLLWDDESLNPEEPTDWQKAWQPRVTIANCKEVEDDFFTREATDPKLIKLPKWKRHKVLHARKFYLTLSQLYELKRFPFDVQLLQIVFRPAEHDALIKLKTMNQAAFRNSISPMVGNMATEWIIHYPQDEEATDDYSLNRPYSLYVVSIPIERHPGFYMYNVVALMFILGTVGLGTFTIDVEMAYVRTDLLLTLVLTLVALKLVTNERLPQITYLTWLDHYMLLTLMFQVTQLMCNFYLAFRQDDARKLADKRDEVLRLDKSILVVICIMWGAMHLLIIFVIIRWRRTAMSLLDQSNASWEKGQRSKRHSTDNNSIVGANSPKNKGKLSTSSTFQSGISSKSAKLQLEDGLRTGSAVYSPRKTKRKANGVAPTAAAGSSAGGAGSSGMDIGVTKVVQRHPSVRRMTATTRGVGAGGRA